MTDQMGHPAVTVGYYVALEAVAHFRVNAQQPPTSTVEGMDFERCAALHNAIVRHAWSASGYSPDKISQTTWWEFFSSPERTNAVDMESLSDSLHPSVRGFLERVLYLPRYPESPNEASFLCHLPGLNAPNELFDSYESMRAWEPEGAGAYLITLYYKHVTLGSDFFDGIM